MKQSMLSDGPIHQHLVNMAIPMGLGLLAVMSFQVIDMFYVSLLGKEALAAISFIFPLIFTVLGLGMGVGVGTMSHVGFFLGQKNDDDAETFATNGLLLMAFLSLFIAIFGLFLLPQTLSMLAVPDDLKILIDDYMTTWYKASSFILVPIVGNSIIRSTGDSKTPSLIMTIAGMTNIFLDPLLIFGWGPVPAYGFKGASIATAISYFITLVASLSILTFRLKIIRWPRLNAYLFMSWKKILYIGVPVGLTAMFTPLSQAFLMRFVTSEGVAATAAFGVSFRIESFAMIGVMALGHVISPIVSQNFGAGHFDRIEECFRVSLKWSAVWCFAITLLLVGVSPWLGHVFSDHTDIIYGVALYCWIVPITFWWQGLLDFLMALFNSLQKPFHSVLLIVLRLFILTIPLGYLGVQTLGLSGLYLGRACANVLSGLVAGALAYYLLKGLRNQDG